MNKKIRGLRSTLSVYDDAANLDEIDIESFNERKKETNIKTDKEDDKEC